MGSAVEAADRPIDPSPARDRWRIAAVLGLIASILLAGLLFLCPDWWDHRLTPEPDGLVMQVRVREDTSFLTRDHHVFSVDRDGPAIALFDDGCDGSRPYPKTLTLFRFPSGEVLEHIVNPSDAEMSEVRRNAWKPGARFDFNGDGVEDRTRFEFDVVFVDSGADGSLLWSQTDPLEYEHPDRLWKLGDLDGDGCSELAVLHPRWDRSLYDWEPFDLVLGARGWLSIVSGAEATKR